MTATDIVRSRSVERADGCRIWLGQKTPKGYGQLFFAGKKRYAHRVVYEDAHGPVENRLHVHHRCGTPDCVELDHLEAIDVRAHNRRHAGVTETHCALGHAFDQANTYFHTRRNGRTERRCKRCDNARWMRRYRARRGDRC